jgi:hypothetical protein
MEKRVKWLSASKSVHGSSPTRANSFGWRAVAFELRFEPGYTDGLDWIQSPAAQEEIDRLCNQARNRTNRRVA